MTKTTKKAFDFKRDSIYVADPLDLCIIGGKGLLHVEEAGPLDTEWKDGDPLKDLKRLKKALEPEFKANVSHAGVKVPIIIAKVNDIATVVAGKSRVRALRAANRERKKEGLPLYKVRCVMQRDSSPKALFATMVTENNARRDDDLADKIEKAKSMVDGGISEADVANHFAVKATTIRGWLAFDDAATDLTKQAVKDGRVGASTAAELAKIKDPDEQNKALAEMIAAPTPHGKSARAAKTLRKGKTGIKNASDRKTQGLLLASMQATDRPRLGPVALAFWEGAEEMLKLVLGSDPDQRMLDALKAARDFKPEAVVK